VTTPTGGTSRTPTEGTSRTLAITVIAADRPGIIARVAAVLADHRMNLADSSMTVLQGHLAMTLICTGATDRDAVAAALLPAAGDDLIIHVHEVPGTRVAARSGGSYLLTVHGADRLGIVAALTGAVAEAGGNITDLTTHLSGALYVLAAEVDLPPGADVEELRARITRVAGELSVDAELQPVERDDL
jgi:glycine cleavage system transcriptional repressor